MRRVTSTPLLRDAPGCWSPLRWRNPLRKLPIALLLLVVVLAGDTSAQFWTPTAQFPGINGADTALLLTDGTVMVQEFSTGNWWRLTPDNYGSYIAGTWSPLASMQPGYTPYAYASAVLPDGRVIVEGGEYGPYQNNLGAIFDPTVNPMGQWTPVLPPAGWTTISDAPSVVLPDGTFMLGNAYTKEEALLNPTTLTWMPTGLYQVEYNNEVGWTLLPGMVDSPSGSVLVVNAFFLPPDGRTSERYFPPPYGFWSPAGSTIVSLFPCGSFSGCEIGPAVLRPDGTVFATGASFTTNPAHTAFYHTATADPDYATWTAGPDFPLDPSGNGLGITDGAGALLPNGNVLLAAAVSLDSHTYFYEFTLAPNYGGGSFVQVPAPPNAQYVPSQEVHLLVLPTGQIMYTDLSHDVEIYTPAPGYDSTWAPQLLDRCFGCDIVHIFSTNIVRGLRLNGMSQGAMFGDDAQMATNYPLVRITSDSSTVYYCRSHHHTSMGVATGNLLVSTYYDCPNVPVGTHGILQVVANGIPSKGLKVTVVP